MGKEIPLLRGQNPAAVIPSEFRFTPLDISGLSEARG